MFGKSTFPRQNIAFVLVFIFAVFGLQWFILTSESSLRTNIPFFDNNFYLWSACSTLLAAILGLIIHPKLSKSITILGSTPNKNLVIAFLPMLAFAVVGLDNDLGWNPWLFGLVFSGLNSLYAFGEELAWRRYLQNALDGRNVHIKYLFIGLVWWLWHGRFENTFDWTVFPLICLAGGYLLGKLTDDTKSMLPATAMHTLIILTTNAGRFGTRELLGIGVVIMGWIVIEKSLKNNNQV